MAVIKRFIPLEGVKKGDFLLTYDGTEELVESIEFVPSTEYVYNLEVSGNHNYYAGGVLVHNKWGKWEGDDKETKAAVGKDQASWQATIDAMDLLNQKARSLTTQTSELAEPKAEVFELQTELADVDLEAQVQDFLTQKSASEFQAGQAGLVSGTAVQNVAKGEEDFARSLQAQASIQPQIAEKTFEIDKKADEFGLEAGLYGIAQEQSNLYSAFIKGMASQGTPPKYTGGYFGGDTWTDPIIGPKEPKLGLACFPADIKVDGKEISEIKIGDMVSSYNEETGIVEKAEIIKTFRHKHDDGYLVINGRIKATANHPFYIRRNV